MRKSAERCGKCAEIGPSAHIYLLILMYNLDQKIILDHRGEGGRGLDPLKIDHQIYEQPLKSWAINYNFPACTVHSFYCFFVCSSVTPDWHIPTSINAMTVLCIIFRYILYSYARYPINSNIYY